MNREFLILCTGSGTGGRCGHRRAWGSQKAGVAVNGSDFLCGSCNRCWHAELGFVRRVRPTACDGCPQRERCADAYAADQDSA